MALKGQASIVEPGLWLPGQVTRSANPAAGSAMPVAAAAKGWNSGLQRPRAPSRSTADARARVRASGVRCHRDSADRTRRPAGASILGGGERVAACARAAFSTASGGALPREALDEPPAAHFPAQLHPPVDHRQFPPRQRNAFPLEHAAEHDAVAREQHAGDAPGLLLARERLERRRAEARPPPRGRKRVRGEHARAPARRRDQPAQPPERIAGHEPVPDELRQPRLEVPGQETARALQVLGEARAAGIEREPARASRRSTAVSRLDRRGRSPRRSNTSPGGTSASPSQRSRSSRGRRHNGVLRTDVLPRPHSRPHAIAPVSASSSSHSRR